MRRKVLIYDSRHEGHHLLCVKYVASVFLEKGYEVVYATHPDTVTSEQFKYFLASIQNRLTIVFIPIKLKPRINSIRIILETLNIMVMIYRQKVDSVFLPWMDPAFYTLGTFGWALIPRMRGKIEGIFFKGDYAYGSKNLTYRQKFKRFLATVVMRGGYFSRVLFLDALGYEFHRNRNARSATVATLCPEYLEDRAFQLSPSGLGKDWGVPLGAKLLGSVGVLDERKGTHLLIQAFRGFVNANPQSTDNCYLLLAGKLSLGVRALVANADDPRIIVVDRFLTDDELTAAIGLCDVVAVPYMRHAGSSQILIRAAAQHKPVLASDYGTVGFLARKYQLGKVVNVSSYGELMDGISWAFEHPTANTDLCTWFAEQNTVVEFCKAVAESP